MDEIPTSTKPRKGDMKFHQAGTVNIPMLNMALTTRLGNPAVRFSD